MIPSANVVSVVCLAHRPGLDLFQVLPRLLLCQLTIGSGLLSLGFPLRPQRCFIAQ